MKKIIWLAAAAGLVSYLYKRYSKPEGLGRVEDAADDTYTTLNHHINKIERKTDDILN